MRDILQEALVALRHNRRRSLLTMLGMAWGIATVVLLLAYGNGFGQAITNIFSSFGMKSMAIVPGRSSMQAGGQKAGTTVQLHLDDIDTLSANIPQITRIAPEVDKDCNVQFENRTFTFTVTGGYPNSAEIKVLSPAQGRFYNADDMDQRARVVVLGSEAKEKLFSGRNAVGEYVRIDGIRFEVIGVLAPKMQEGDSDLNRINYVPFSTMSDLKNTYVLSDIWINYETDDYLGLEQTIREVLAMQHRFSPGDRRAVMIFSVMSQLHQYRMITLGLQFLLGFIGTLTLGIGGVGLMNIMLVSVTQRTREIGMLKALGCPRGDIFLQFLAEALAISFLGGVFGMILAYGVSLSAGRLTLYSAMAKHAEAGDIRLLIDPLTLVIATGILAIVGLVSGMLPAIHASRLNPIEALRYE